MLAQLLSGNIPLLAPKHVMLSPLALLIRCSVLARLPVKSKAQVASDPVQISVSERDAKAADDSSKDRPNVPPSTDVTPLTDVAISRRPRKSDAQSPATQPTIPAFALKFHDDAAMVETLSELVLFLPDDDARPLPVRVVERSACKAKWYSVESWHANARRWVERGVSAKEEAALDIAREMPWLRSTQNE
jgi:hypothetical protein